VAWSQNTKWVSQNEKSRRGRAPKGTLSHRLTLRRTSRLCRSAPRLVIRKLCFYSAESRIFQSVVRPTRVIIRVEDGKASKPCRRSWKCSPHGSRRAETTCVTPTSEGYHSLKLCMRSRGEIEAAVCGAVARFQQDYLGRGPRDIQTRLIDATLIVHLRGVLSVAEQRLLEGPTAADGRGAELVKQLRSHLVLSGRAVLEGLVADATGSRPVNVHHDISTVTGEEVIVVTLAAAPECRTPRKR